MFLQFYFAYSYLYFTTIEMESYFQSNKVFFVLIGALLQL